MTSGYTAELGEKEKHSKNDIPCTERGWVCVPLVGTNTSAGRVLSFVEVSPQPLSSSGARQALWQKSAKLS